VFFYEIIRIISSRDTFLGSDGDANARPFVRVAYFIAKYIGSVDKCGSNRFLA